MAKAATAESQAPQGYDVTTDPNKNDRAVLVDNTSELRNRATLSRLNLLNAEAVQAAIDLMPKTINTTHGVLKFPKLRFSDRLIKARSAGLITELEDEIQKKMAREAERYVRYVEAGGEPEEFEVDPVIDVYKPKAAT